MSVYIGLTGLEARGLSPCAYLETELNTSLVVKVKSPDMLATLKTGLHQGSMHKNTTSALLLFLIHLLHPALLLSEFLLPLDSSILDIFGNSKIIILHTASSSITLRQVRTIQAY